MIGLLGNNLIVKLLMNLVNQTSEKIDQGFFEKIAKATFGYLNEKSRGDIEVILVDKNKIKKLNKKYRQIDKSTDILTFKMGEKKLFGQIFICPEAIRSQAKKRNAGFEKELAEIFIHGILHLLDFNDQTKKGYEEMVKKQKEVLANLNC